MKGYKAFEKGMVCLGKQYAENTVFEEDEAVLCKKGMHFCKEPLDVLRFYPLVDDNGNISEFAEVEAIGEAISNDGIKYCTKTLKIGRKINFVELIMSSVDDEKYDAFCMANDIIGSSGYSAKIGSSGDMARIASSGDSTTVLSTGENAVVMCAGRLSRAKAKKGSWITLAEYSKDGVPVCVKTRKVDGKRIKEDTFYTLRNGKFEECK